MEMLQGNTYLKPVRVEDSNGNVVTADRVAKVEIVFGDLYKYYGTEDGEVVWDAAEKCFIVPLTEEDTFSLEGAVECQVRAVLVDGSVSGSKPEGHYVYESKSKTRLTEGGAGAESGELLTLKLLKEFSAGGGGSGGIVEETDPTVPKFVKDITRGDIANWNNKSDFSGSYNDLTNKPTIPSVEGLASEDYVDTKVADLVNSAPETLDTLGEVAKAIQENESVVDALNSAIGNKADKSELPTKVSELENDKGFITIDDVPSGGEIDTSNLVTKEEFNKVVNNETQINPTRLGDTYIAGGTSQVTGQYGVVIGKGAINNGNSNVVIGRYAGAGTGSNTVLIGSGAKTYSSKKVVQLGAGTNTTDNTLQIFDKNIYNHSTDTLTVANITLNGVDLGTQLGDLNTALETILGV